jgi:hypothetical protein
MTTNTTTMTSDDIEEFNSYLAKCTDKQVLGVLEKELKANRKEYAALARQEARRRDIY